jgi:hypothetical protein
MNEIAPRKASVQQIKSTDRRDNLWKRREHLETMHLMGN